MGDTEGARRPQNFPEGRRGSQLRHHSLTNAMPRLSQPEQSVKRVPGMERLAGVSVTANPQKTCPWERGLESQQKPPTGLFLRHRQWQVQTTLNTA